MKNREKYNERKYAEFQKSSGKTVNYLVKRFEMKKSASQYARAAVSRTGVLNTNSLYKYKLTDDIFESKPLFLMVRTTVSSCMLTGLVL